MPWLFNRILVLLSIKFRANDAWSLDYGLADINELSGELIRTGDSINISEGGNFTITIDFNKSEEPYIYKYSVVKN